jgi:hypothetical protein
VPTFFINGQKFTGQASWGSPQVDELAKSLKPFDELYCGLTDQLMPEDAQGFMTWCKQNGFAARDFQGATCNAAVGAAVSVKAAFGAGAGCAALKTKSDSVRTNDGYEEPFSRPIYQWLLAHPEKVRGRAIEAIQAAVAVIYGCH